MTSIMFGSGDVPEAHPLGTEWQINDFSCRVAEMQYEEVCEAACNEEECEGCSTPATYIGEFKAYSYCGCSDCCGWGSHPTASGKMPEEGRTVAVDTSVIPMGSKIALEYPDGSFRELIAEDTGGAIQGNVLDVYIADHQRALEHGVQNVKVYKEVK